MILTIIGEEVYFLSKGDCEVFIVDEINKTCLVRTLKPGSYFGEVGLLKKCPRTATVKSKNYTTCASVNLEKFQKLVLRFPFIGCSMETNIKAT